MWLSALFSGVMVGLGILFCTLCLMTVIGFTYRPKFAETFIFLDADANAISPNCTSVKTACVTDRDCTKCSEEEMRCTETGPKKKRYCLPQRPAGTCSEAHGGSWTYTGFQAVNNGTWTCDCAYPAFFGGNGCAELNPGVCEGGTFNYDARTAGRPPIAEDCVCPSDHHLMKTLRGGVPLCIPKSVCDSKAMCEALYSERMTEFVR